MPTEKLGAMVLVADRSIGRASEPADPGAGYIRHSA